MVIFRNDDVSPSSNFDDIEKIYGIIREKFPTSRIWSCVTICSKGSAGSVYPDLPLKDKSNTYLYNVDRLWEHRENLGTIVSHGLLHVKHGKLCREAQEMSIVTSCNLLNTSIFVPPFTDYNRATQEICIDNGICLSSDKDGWKSLETEKFDPNHDKWFFHSWRFTPESFAEKLK